MLQRCAEIMEYHELLNKAAQAADPFHRLAYVTAFFCSVYGGVERTGKPFNPVLGETYYLQLKANVRFFAEQVSHHPPIAAAHAEGEMWEYDITSAPKTKFMGTYLDVFPFNLSRVRLKSTGEVFCLKSPRNIVYNILLGRMWIDTCGPMLVRNVTTGDRCELEFSACGWLSRGHHEVAGHIRGSDALPCLAMQGLWNHHLEFLQCANDGSIAEVAPVTRMWENVPKPENNYHFTKFVRDTLNSFDPDHCGSSLLSDSRFRPDRFALRKAT